MEDEIGTDIETMTSHALRHLLFEGEPPPCDLRRQDLLKLSEECGLKRLLAAIEVSNRIAHASKRLLEEG